MQHDNNIENKLREMEAMEQPDLSQVDAHWQQMAAILQPSVLPVKKGWPKWMLNTLSIAAVLILIGTAVLYMSGKKGNNIEMTAPKNETFTQQNNISSKEDLNGNTGVPVITDNSIEERTTTLIKPTIDPSLIYNDIAADTNAKKWTEQDSILGTLKLNYTPCQTCPVKENTVSPITKNEVRLANLFGQLEKEEQRFIIDNSRDTLLRFKEGTALLIPVNSFGGITGITITAKEFYKRSDIILNQLNTESNKDQLETGGMLYLQASYKGKEVNINKDKPVALFMADTSSRMNNMQLFYRQNNVSQETQMSNTVSSDNVTWVAQPFRFTRLNTVNMVHVLNLVDMPYAVKTKRGKTAAYFLVDEELQVPKDVLKKLLKEKYGYDRIKLRNAEWWEVHTRSISWTESSTGYFNSFYATKIGDSMWMEKSLADKYKLVGTATKTETINNNYIPLSFRGYQIQPDYFEQTFDKLNSQTAQDLKNKYGVSLNQLGWINCDRFYTDSRKKIRYKVDLEDSAANYYTMLVFDNINSMMTGYVNGKEVMFQNVPVGEPVKIISIGINQKGETVYSVTHTTTSEQELKGLQFQTTSAPDLKTSLSKLDK